MCGGAIRYREWGWGEWVCPARGGLVRCRGRSLPAAAANLPSVRGPFPGGGPVPVGCFGGRPIPTGA